LEPVLQNSYPENVRKIMFLCCNQNQYNANY